MFGTPPRDTVDTASPKSGQQDRGVRIEETEADMSRCGDSETLAREARLAIHQCGHGLLHLRVNRVTLTLTPEEFARLAMVVGEAYMRLGTRESLRAYEAH